MGIERRVVQDERPELANAVVGLWIAVDGLRREATRLALDDPLGAIGEGHQRAQRRQVVDPVNLGAGNGPGDRIVILHREGIAEVREHAGPAEPQGLGLVVGAGIAQTLLEVADRPGEVAGAHERISASRRRVGLGRAHVVVGEAGRVRPADEAVNAGASVVLVDVVVGRTHHRVPHHSRLEVVRLDVD
ncbi:hypothetical protein D3C84_783920 [compost metagenome]